MVDQTELKIEINTNTEITFPGDLIIELIMNILQHEGIGAVLGCLHESEIYIYNPKPGIYQTALLPRCSCGNCTKVKDKAREMIRTKGLTPDLKKQLIEWMNKGHGND